MMNLNITLIMKFNFDVLALYVFLMEDIFWNICDGFNYDDSHEIIISRSILCTIFVFIHHHFLMQHFYIYRFYYSLCQFTNNQSCICFRYFFFTKKLYEKLSFTYLSFVLSGFILLSSLYF